MTPKLRRSWRVVQPERRGWLYLLASPSSYLLVFALVLTMGSKLAIIRGYSDVDHWFFHWLLACARDVAVFMAFATLLALGERIRGWFAFLTVPIAILVTALAVMNAGYMSISGEQLSWQLFVLGLDRFDDVSGIAKATVLGHPLRLAGCVLLLAAPPLITRWIIKKRQWNDERRGVTLARAKAAGFAAVVALLIVIVSPLPQRYALARMYSNTVVRMYQGMVGDHEGNQVIGFFSGYDPKALVDSSDIERLRTSSRPNIVIVVLESTREDDTSLLGATGKARTPNLEALAARGVEAAHAYSAITQTSKSVWSILCGRLPLLQTKIYEISDTIDAQCLPDIVNAAGYRTAFIQSAMGTFEDRPRLVHELGFQSFTASEHISGEVDGYLASDDATMKDPLFRWIDGGKGPFMATLLTSSTHHPYALSKARRAAFAASGLAVDSDRDRYDRGIEIADALIGDIVSELRTRGLLDTTIIVVVGDHGEGFGDTGVRQHGSNFYEEGLHVPFVMAGPGVPHTVVETPVSLVDVTPTLLARLGLGLKPRVTASTGSFDVMSAPADRTIPFACYYDDLCEGFIRGRTKVVHIPETGQAFSFDLASDPRERNPTPLTAALRRELTQVQQLLAAHRAVDWPLERAGFATFPDWKCEPRKSCRAIAPLPPQPSD